MYGVSGEGGKMKQDCEPTITPAFLRPEQAAVYTSISSRYLSELARKGLLPVARIGRKCTLYAKSDLDTLVASFRTGRARR